MPTSAEQFDRAFVGLLLGHLIVRAQLLNDLPADGVDRRERGHRVLEDHADLAAAHATASRCRESPRISRPSNTHAARDLRRWRRARARASSTSRRSCPIRTRPRCRAPLSPRRRRRVRRPPARRPGAWRRRPTGPARSRRRRRRRFKRQRGSSGRCRRRGRRRRRSASTTKNAPYMTQPMMSGRSRFCRPW